MSTLYPSEIDSNATLPTVMDLVTPVAAQTVNQLRDAIIAVESELGVKPSGIYSTLRGRLEAIEASISSGGTVTLGGDLSGAPASAKVVGLQGYPVSSQLPLSGQSLTWNGATWLPQASAVPATSKITVGTTGSGAQYICDGVNDEVEINAAIVQANATGKSVVEVLPGIYFISGPINLLSNVSLEGSGSGTAKIVIATGFNEASLWAIGCSGSELTGTAINLSVDASFGGQVLTCSASAELTAVEVNKYLFLESNATWEISTNPPAPFTPASGRKRGEFVQVLANGSSGANTLDIYGMVRDSYLVSDTARMYRMNLIENVGIKNLEIYQQAPAQTRVGSPNPAISIQKTRNATIENVRIHDIDGPAITLYQCIAVRINKCYIHDLANNTSVGYYGYGILIGGASENIAVNGCNMDRLRHGIDAGPSIGISSPTSNYGVPRGVSITNNIVTRATNAAYSTHNESENWSFVGNVASNGLSYGMFMRGRGMSLIGNTIEWCGGGIGIGDSTWNSSGGSGSGANVTGNTIRHIKNQASILASYVTLGITSSTYALGEGIILGLTDNSVIADNVISNCDRAGIRLRVFAINNIIRNNTIINCNLRNVSGSSSEAIVFDSDFSLTNASITFSGGTCTLTSTGAGFHAAFAGRKITITGAATSGNNGTFTVLTVASTTSVTYANASGATDANNGTITYWLEGSTDNTFDSNYAANTPVSLYDRDTTGHIKYVIRDYGALGNIRNTFKNNTGFRMETGLMLVNSNSFQSGNSTTESVPIRVLTAIPDDSNFLSAPQVGTLAYNTTNTGTYVRTSTTNTWKRIDFNTTDQWDSTVTPVRLNQADTAIASATGQNLTVRAQNATGTTSNGGSLLLAPGSGTTSNGTVRFTDPAGNNAVGITPAPTGNTSFTFSGGVTAINFNQSATSTANGATFQITAQNASSTFNGGNIGLSAGNGTGTGNGGSINVSTGTGTALGSINFRSGSTTFFTFLSPNPTGAVSGNFVSTITGVSLLHGTTASATGGNFIIQAQNAATTGGALQLTSGTGSSSANAGAVAIQTGGIAKLTINPTITTSVNPISIGTTPSTTGDIRLTNAATIKARNAGNTADVQLMSLDSGNVIRVGDNTGSIVMQYSSTWGAYNGSAYDLLVSPGTVANISNTSLGSSSPTYGGGTLVTFINDASVVPSTNPTGGAILYSAGGRLKYRGSDGYIASLETSDPTINGFRLSLTNSVSVPTSDVVGASTLYFTPHTSGAISLWDGSYWRVIVAQTQPSLTLTGLTAGSNYDVFAYKNGTDVSIELGPAWTSVSVRSVAIVRQSGVWVKSGDPTRRYVGSIKAITSNTTQDSVFSRYVYNEYNKVDRTMVYLPASPWTCQSTTRQANSVIGFQLDLIVGNPTQIDITIVAPWTNPGTYQSGQFYYVGVGIGNTTIVSQGAAAQLPVTGYAAVSQAQYQTVQAAGYVSYWWLESASLSPANASIYSGVAGILSSSMKLFVKM